ncbi:acyltransferase domain-containing protein [Streptomyces sp. M19]
MWCWAARPTVRPPPDDRPQLVLLSAHRDDALADLADATATALDAGEADRADAAYTLHTGRGALPHRAAAVIGAVDRTRSRTSNRTSKGTATGAAARALRAARRRAPAPPAPRRPRLPRRRCPVRGHGARTSRPGSGVRPHRRGVRRPLRPRATGGDHRRARRPRVTERLRDPAHGLPALFTASLATARTLRAWGVEADALVGHSLGEYAAAVLAGALSLRDAASLVTVRSRGMSGPPGAARCWRCPRRGGGPGPARRPPRPRAGPRGRQRAGILRGLRARPGRGRAGAAARRRRRTGHPAAPRRRRALPAGRPGPAGTARGGRGHGPARPGRSAGHDPHRRPAADGPGADHWVPHLRSVVRFSAALRTAMGAGPALVVQAGPGSGLLQLARQHGVKGLLATLPTLPGRDAPGAERAALLATAGELWTHGVDLAADALHRRGGGAWPRPRCRGAVPAPPPVDRGAAAVHVPGRPAGGATPVPGEDEPFHLPTWRRTRHRTRWSRRTRRTRRTQSLWRAAGSSRLPGSPGWPTPSARN